MDREAAKEAESGRIGAESVLAHKQLLVPFEVVPIKSSVARLAGFPARIPPPLGWRFHLAAQQRPFHFRSLTGWFYPKTDKCFIQFIETNNYITLGTAIAAFYGPVTVMCVLYWRVWRETENRQKDLVNLQAGKKNDSHRSNSRYLAFKFGAI